MKAYVKWMTGAAVAAAALASAAPASAQYYDPYYDRYYYDRGGDTIGRVVSGVAAVAGAVAAATQGGYYDPRYGYGYGNQYGNRYGAYGYGYGGGEQFAANACALSAQRRYGGRAAIQSVQWTRSNRLRVYGTVDRGGGYYGGFGYRPVAFTCSVRPDGRVTGFSTRRYRYGYRY